MERSLHYINSGAPFDRDDGTRVARGDVIEPTEKELVLFRYKLRLFKGDVATAPKPRQKPPRHQEPAAPGRWGKDWPLQMDPDLYLKLHPEGTYAKLARMVSAQPELEVEGSEGGDSDE